MSLRRLNYVELDASVLHSGLLQVTLHLFKAQLTRLRILMSSEDSPISLLEVQTYTNQNSEL